MKPERFSIKHHDSVTVSNIQHVQLKQEDTNLNLRSSVRIVYKNIFTCLKSNDNGLSVKS